MNQKFNSLRIGECKSPDEWNEFVRKYGTVHHLFEWTYINQKTFSCRCVNLACWDGSNILAIYPFIVRGRWPIRWYVSPTDFDGGPIGDPDAVLKLVGEVDRKAKREWISTNAIRYGEEGANYLSHLGFDVVERRNLVLDINRPEKEIWTTLRDKVRNSIRKSQKQEIVVTEGGIGDLNDYLKLVKKHSASIGYRPRTERFIRTLFEHLDATLLVAKWQGILVGGCVYLNFGGRASAINATRDPEKTDLRIGEAQHWEGIRYYREKGYTEYDFMSRNDNHVLDGTPYIYPNLATLHRFKLGWQPKEKANYDLTYVYSKYGMKARGILAKLRDQRVWVKNKIQRMQNSIHIPMA